MKLLKHGSVKDIYQVDGNERLVFTFSDRYSVFDWGEMPDCLENKGKSLAFFCSFFFKQLEDAVGWKKWLEKRNEEGGNLGKRLAQKGLKTHFVSALDRHKKPVDDIFDGHDSIMVEKCPVPAIFFRRGSYDYSYYKEKRTHSLVPLEVIFRHGLPTGSSLLKRLGDSDYLKELGLREIPKEGHRFDEPIIEFSTKLEKSDRYISQKEALEIAGMTSGEMATLKKLARLLALRIKDIFEEINVELWDGKFEFSFIPEGDERGFKLVDSIGPDEVRLLKHNLHFSKEVFRSFYRDSSWLNSVEKARKLAKEKGVSDWKSICVEELRSRPQRLPEHLKQRGEWIYQSLCNALAQKFYDRPLFDKVPSLDELTEKKVVIVGSGGREHALAWKMAKSPLVGKVIVIPGNEGMMLTPKVEILSPSEDVLSTITATNPDLVIIGPEQYLVEGLVNKLQEKGLPVFGPTKEASLLESSKAFMKELLVKLNIPTASFKVAATVEEAKRIINNWPSEALVVKCDGLAGGKGVVVCTTKEEAHEASEAFLVDDRCSVKSKRLIIEEALVGEELSSFYLCDGKRPWYLASAKDYKRVFDGNRGPNTGGMGGHISENWPSAPVREQLDNIARRTVTHMAERGTPFSGVLFIGCMIVEKEKVMVLEFNVRFGDPETQIILPALKNDLFEILSNIMRGKQPQQDIHLCPSVHVVASSRGYPSTNQMPIETGHPISFGSEGILEGQEDTVVFMAGVKRKNGGFVNTGGRVLGVTSVSERTVEAREKSYAALKKVAFEGMHYRRDIADNV